MRFVPNLVVLSALRRDACTVAGQYGTYCPLSQPMIVYDTLAESGILWVPNTFQKEN